MNVPIDKLPTPALLIDFDRVENNIRKMAELIGKSGKKLRPHIKTHKIPQLALLQIEQGACGICTAKVSEAEVMADAGIKDIMIANEVVGYDKLQRVAELAQRVHLSILADSDETVSELIKVAEQYEVFISVLVEIDAGDNRCGCSPEKAVELARKIRMCPYLRFAGIEAFGGFVYHCENSQEELRLVKELTIIMRRAKTLLEEAEIPVREVSVGGSPAIRLLAEEDLFTELRPGVYIFSDAASVSRGSASYLDCAVSVLTTVISHPTETRMVVDGGAKTFSYCRPGVVFGHKILHGVIKDYTEICLSSLSEEHGVFQTECQDALNNWRVGDKIQVIPAHVCPVINLFDYAYLCRNDVAFEKIHISARGMSL